MFWNKQGNKQSQQHRTGSEKERGARDDGILKEKNVIRISAEVLIDSRNDYILATRITINCKPVTLPYSHIIESILS